MTDRSEATIKNVRNNVILEHSPVWNFISFNCWFSNARRVQIVFYIKKITTIHKRRLWLSIIGLIVQSPVGVNNEKIIICELF